MVENGILMHVLNSDVHLAVEFILLPLIQCSTIWDIFQRCVKEKTDPNAGVGVSSGSCSTFNDYLKSVGDLLITKVLLSNTYSPEEKRKLFSSLRMLGINIPTNVFYNERSMLFYHILLQVCVDDPAELQKLMSSGLHGIISTMYHLQNGSVSFDPLGRIDFAIAAFHNVQLQLIWDLGSEDKNLGCRASRALQVVSIIGEKYSLHEDLGGVDSVDMNLRNYLAENLPKHFLFITRNLLLAQHDWAKESTHYQVNCIRSLKSIICCFNVSDLCKFLPKVLFHCETFLEL